MNDTYFGQLLISMPNLIDPFFQKTVILICEFSEKAIMGLIINKPVQNIKVSNILKNIKLDVNDKLVNQDVFIGGPVHTGQGFILHSSECKYDGSEIINKNLRLTTSLKILEDISNNKPPKFYKVFLGCSVWGYKQFNNEMLENSWHLMNTSNQIIFQNNEINKIWEICVEKSGIVKEKFCLLYTSPSPRDLDLSRMPSSA